MTKRYLTFVLALLTTSAGPAAIAQKPIEALPPSESFPDHLRYIYSNRNGGPADSGGQLLADRKLWQRGDVLKVCFFGGNPIVKTLVAATASQWNSLSSVKLDFGSDGKWRDCMDASAGFSQIRIGFGDRGYWSAIGTDSNNLLNAMQPSMNFGGFDRKYNPFQPNSAGAFYTPSNVVADAKPYDRGVVLHEFGHALGLMHEHQNPNLDCFNEIKWSGQNNVYDFYAGDPNYWDKAKVDFNIGQGGIAYISLKAGQPDPSSIMMYSQPPEIFKSGEASKCYVKPNNTISSLDRQFIAQVYPMGATASADVQMTLAPLPAVNATVASSPSSRQDLLDRVGTDLLSDITSVRREARRQLSSLLQASQSPQLAADLAEESIGKSYRHKLGVITALGNTTLPFDAAPAAKAEMLKSLSTLSASNRDPSLTQSLSRAVTAVKGLKE